MNKRYNLNNLEALFKDFLLSGIKKSKNTIKNYLSDLRHFLGWFQKMTKDNNTFFLYESDIEEYKKYLFDSEFPIKTVNRRLSTIRKFCFFCVRRGILRHDPSITLKNISPQKILHNKIDDMVSIMDTFRNDLISEGLPNQVIKNHLKDMNEFFFEVKNYG